MIFMILGSKLLGMFNEQCNLIKPYYSDCESTNLLDAHTQNLFLARSCGLPSHFVELGHPNKINK